MDLQAQDFAKEHREFLENNRPDVLSALRQSGDLDSYLSSVGEEASSMYDKLMADRYHQFKNQPYHDLVRELQAYRHEVVELIRHDLINQPLSER
jgi:transposon-encoded protein TnpV